ncbi:MAG: SpoIIIAH-like family protein [Bacilli bacterium]
MVSKKKKILVLSIMVVLLVATGFLNLTLSNNIVTEAGTTSSNFFTTYRADRTSTRNEEQLYYEAIISSASSSADAKAVAEAKKIELIQTMELELVVEGLIKAKGFEDAIVTLTTSNINVIVKAPDATLLSTEVAQIFEIVKEQTTGTIDNIKIIPV